MKFMNILLYGIFGAVGGILAQVLVQVFWESDLSRGIGLPDFQTAPSPALIIVTAVASGMIGGMRYKSFFNSLGCGCLIALILLVGVLTVTPVILSP